MQFAFKPLARRGLFRHANYREFCLVYFSKHTIIESVACPHLVAVFEHAIGKAVVEAIN
jgi:hypothetical protein